MFYRFFILTFTLYLTACSEGEYIPSKWETIQYLKNTLPSAGIQKTYIPSTFNEKLHAYPADIFSTEDTYIYEIPPYVNSIRIRGNTLYFDYKNQRSYKIDMKYAKLKFFKRVGPEQFKKSERKYIRPESFFRITCNGSHHCITHIVPQGKLPQIPYLNKNYYSVQIDFLIFNSYFDPVKKALNRLWPQNVQTDPAAKYFQK